MHSALGVLGVTGFLMKDLRANPLDYVEGGKLSARRQELSSMLDSTDPNLRPFAGRGGRMIVTIGTNDTLASPGAQLDYYQAVIDAMGRAAVVRGLRPTAKDDRPRAHRLQATMRDSRSWSTGWSAASHRACPFA